MRYTEARLSRIATEMLRDIDEDTVDDAPTYDDRRTEPVVLPVAGPEPAHQRLARASPSAWPPTSRRTTWARSSTPWSRLIDDPAIEVEGLMRHIKAPDFPTGGIIVGRAGVVDAYRTGRGRVVVRGRAHNEPLKHGRNAIVFTELPYQVNKAELIRKMADLANDKVIPEIADLRDESGRDGIRVVIELRRDAVPAGGAQQALQAHRRAEHLRRQRHRAGGRRPAHAGPQGDAPATTSRTRRRSSPGARGTGWPGPRRAPTSSRGSSRRSATWTRSSPSSAPRPTPRRPARAS